jgi:hypothetical protein
MLPRDDAIAVALALLPGILKCFHGMMQGGNCTALPLLKMLSREPGLELYSPVARFSKCLPGILPGPQGLVFPLN